MTTPSTPTPRLYKQSVARLSKTAADRNPRIVQDITPKVIGPMPIKKFIRRYLQLPDIPPTRLESISFDSVSAEPRTEKELCVQLATLGTT